MSFPVLTSGSMNCRYPIQGSIKTSTKVLQHVNGSEQRWRCGPRLASFTLTYTDVSSYDLQQFLEFFQSKKGKFVDDALTNTFSVTLGSDTYNYCVFDQDDFDETESKPNRYSFVIKIKQVRPN